MLSGHFYFWHEADVTVVATNVCGWQILLQKSFSEVGLKFSDP
jgi:hypothetical protein